MEIEYNAEKTKFKNPQTGKWVDATKKYGKELLAQYNKGKIPPKRKPYIKKKVINNTLETNNLQSNVFNNPIDLPERLLGATGGEPRKNVPQPIEIKVIHEHVQKEIEAKPFKVKTPPIPVIENKFFPESDSSDEEIEQKDNHKKLFNNVSSFLNNVNIFNIKNKYSRFEITDITDSEDSGYISNDEDDNEN